MTRDPTTRLTEREKQYLRLVGRAMSSKEIANELQVEPGTVDKALKSAMSKLGSSSRREAARLLHQLEFETPHKLGPQTEPIAAPPNPSMLERSKGSWSSEPLSHPMVREEQSPYLERASSENGWSLTRVVAAGRNWGERSHGRQIGRLLLSVGAIALGSLVALATLTTIASGLVKVVSQLLRL